MPKGNKSRARMAKKPDVIAKGTLSMKVAADVNGGRNSGGSTPQRNWVDSKPLRVGNKRLKLSYKWGIVMSDTNNGYYNNGYRSGYRDLIIKVENMTNSDIKATTTLKLVGPDGTNLSHTGVGKFGDKVYKAKGSTEMSLANYSYYCSSLYGWTGAAEADLSCELTILESTPGVAHTELQVNKLVQDLGQIFMDKDHADIKVKCGKKTFDCHRVILSGRSHYFKTMLSWVAIRLSCSRMRLWR